MIKKIDVDCQFDPVISVEDWGSDETIDIEVGDVNCFYARERENNIISISHNSAELAIGDYDDLEFLKAKRWDLSQIPNWRAMSNNSIIPPENFDDLPKEFWDTYQQGEPYGLINLELSRKVGRLGEEQYPDPNVIAYNPLSIAA